MYASIATIRVQTPSTQSILKSTSNVQDNFKSTRSSLRLGPIRISGNFRRDWTMNGSVGTIRMQTPSKSNNLESSKIKDTFVFTRSHVRSGTLGISDNFHKDGKMYSNMATIPVKIPREYDILKSSSKMPSCSLAPTFD